GWCPLLWMQAVGDGHNEALYLALLLLGLVAVEHRRLWPAGACVGTAVAVKLTALVPGAALIWYLLHRDRRAAGLVTLGSLAALAAWTLPYGLTGWNCLRANATELNDVAFFSLPAFLHQIGLPPWLHPIAMAAFTIGFARALWQAPDLSNWLRVAAAAALLFFLTVTSSNQEWYFLMPLAFAAAAPRPWLGFSTLWMAALSPQALRDGLGLGLKDVTLTCWASVFLVIWLEWRAEKSE
ncbi:MAG: glycosyltransferase 87 family protein, partial [Candidatus Xenobia bacterium]